MSISVADGNTWSVLSRLFSLSIDNVRVKLVSSRSDGGGGGGGRRERESLGENFVSLAINGKRFTSSTLADESSRSAPRL